MDGPDGDLYCRKLLRQEITALELYVKNLVNFKNKLPDFKSGQIAAFLQSEKTLIGKITRIEKCLIKFLDDCGRAGRFPAGPEYDTVNRLKKQAGELLAETRAAIKVQMERINRERQAVRVPKNLKMFNNAPNPSCLDIKQ